MNTDAELVALTRCGKMWAFDLLIERYQPLVKRIALSVVPHEEIASELVQDALLAAYLSLHQLREAARFKWWLSHIVLNVCRSYLRDQKTSELSLEVMTEAIDAATIPFSNMVVDPQEVVEGHEQQKDILAAVLALSARESIATFLFYYEQCSLQEIATTLGISVTAVKSRLFKARKQLRGQLAPAYGGEQREQEQPQRRKTMVKVSIEGIRKSLLTDQRVVTLLDNVGHRFMNIRVPRSEALVIMMEIYGISPPQTTTAHFMANVLQATQVTLEEVQIQLLNDEIFYGLARVRNGAIVRELDTRPGDALGLAVLMHAPIVVPEEILEHMGMHLPEGKTVEVFYAEEVLKNVGIVLPEEQLLRLTYGRQRGRDVVLKEIEQLTPAIDQRALSTAEELERTRQQVIAFLEA